MVPKTIRGLHVNPQSIQPPLPPQGWTGNWPPASAVTFPPGYPAPPQMPGVASSYRNAGHQRYNPGANMVNLQQPWAPGAGWFPSKHNVRTRKSVLVKTPSPSYWNTKLSDNGLGLEGMIKRKNPLEYYESDEEPQTPWIWDPPGLLEGGDRANPTRDFDPRRTAMVDSVQDVSTPKQHHDRKKKRLSRARSSPSYWNTELTDNGLGLEGMVKRMNLSEGSDEELQTPRIWNPPSLLENMDRATPERDFNRRKTGLVDTGHYNMSGPPDRMRSGQSRNEFAGPSSSSHRSIGQTDFRPNQAHLHPPAVNQVPPYPAPKPEAIHMPFRYQATRPDAEVVSSDYYPGSLAPEGYFTTPSRRQPIPGLMTWPARPVYASITETSPNSTGVIPNLIMSHESLLPDLPSGEILLAPLRHPDNWNSMDSSLYPSHFWSPVHVGGLYDAQVREARTGSWNRRSDHLTPDGYVVYAPQERAYPGELQNYPEAPEGYQDQYGAFVPWQEERRELPSSSSHNGWPPRGLARR